MNKSGKKFFYASVSAVVVQALIVADFAFSAPEMARERTAAVMLAPSVTIQSRTIQRLFFARTVTELTAQPDTAVLRHSPDDYFRGQPHAGRSLPFLGLLSILVAFSYGGPLSHLLATVASAVAAERGAEGTQQAQLPEWMQLAPDELRKKRDPTTLPYKIDGVPGSRPEQAQSPPVPASDIARMRDDLKRYEGLSAELEQLLIRIDAVLLRFNAVPSGKRNKQLQDQHRRVSAAQQKFSAMALRLKQAITSVRQGVEFAQPEHVINLNLFLSAAKDNVPSIQDMSAAKADLEELENVVAAVEKSLAAPIGSAGAVPTALAVSATASLRQEIEHLRQEVSAQRVFDLLWRAIVLAGQLPSEESLKTRVQKFDDGSQLQQWAAAVRGLQETVKRWQVFLAALQRLQSGSPQDNPLLQAEKLLSALQKERSVASELIDAGTALKAAEDAVRQVVQMWQAFTQSGQADNNAALSALEQLARQVTELERIRVQLPVERINQPNTRITRLSGSLVLPAGHPGGVVTIMPAKDRVYRRGDPVFMVDNPDLQKRIEAEQNAMAETIRTVGKYEQSHGAIETERAVTQLRGGVKLLRLRIKLFDERVTVYAAEPMQVHQWHLTTGTNAPAGASVCEYGALRQASAVVAANDPWALTSVGSGRLTVSSLWGAESSIPAQVATMGYDIVFDAGIPRVYRKILLETDEGNDLRQFEQSRLSVDFPALTIAFPENQPEVFFDGGLGERFIAVPGMVASGVNVPVHSPVPESYVFTVANFAEVRQGQPVARIPEPRVQEIKLLIVDIESTLKQINDLLMAAQTGDASFHPILSEFTETKHELAAKRDYLKNTYLGAYATLYAPAAGMIRFVNNGAEIVTGGGKVTAIMQDDPALRTGTKVLFLDPKSQETAVVILGRGTITSISAEFSGKEKPDTVLVEMSIDSSAVPGIPILQPGLQIKVAVPRSAALRPQAQVTGNNLFYGMPAADTFEDGESPGMSLLFSPPALSAALRNRRSRTVTAGLLLMTALLIAGLALPLGGCVSRGDVVRAVEQKTLPVPAPVLVAAARCPSQWNAFDVRMLADWIRSHNIDAAQAAIAVQIARLKEEFNKPGLKLTLGAAYDPATGNWGVSGGISAIAADFGKIALAASGNPAAIASLVAGLTAQVGDFMRGKPAIQRELAERATEAERCARDAVVMELTAEAGRLMMGIAEGSALIEQLEELQRQVAAHMSHVEQRAGAMTSRSTGLDLHKKLTELTRKLTQLHAERQTNLETVRTLLRVPAEALEAGSVAAGETAVIRISPEQAFEAQRNLLTGSLSNPRMHPLVQLAVRREQLAFLKILKISGAQAGVTFTGAHSGTLTGGDYTVAAPVAIGAASSGLGMEITVDLTPTAGAEEAITVQEFNQARMERQKVQAAVALRVGTAVNAVNSAAAQIALLRAELVRNQKEFKRVEAQVGKTVRPEYFVELAMTIVEQMIARAEAEQLYRQNLLYLLAVGALPESAVRVSAVLSENPSAAAIAAVAGAPHGFALADAEDARQAQQPGHARSGFWRRFAGGAIGVVMLSALPFLATELPAADNPAYPLYQSQGGMVSPESDPRAARYERLIQPQEWPEKLREQETLFNSLWNENVSEQRIAFVLWRSAAARDILGMVSVLERAQQQYQAAARLSQSGNYVEKKAVEWLENRSRYIGAVAYAALLSLMQSPGQIQSVLDMDIERETGGQLTLPRALALILSAVIFSGDELATDNFLRSEKVKEDDIARMFIWLERMGQQPGQDRDAVVAAMSRLEKEIGRRNVRDMLRVPEALIQYAEFIKVFSRLSESIRRHQAAMADTLRNWGNSAEHSWVEPRDFIDPRLWEESVRRGRNTIRDARDTLAGDSAALENIPDLSVFSLAARQHDAFAALFFAMPSDEQLLLLRGGHPLYRAGDPQSRINLIPKFVSLLPVISDARLRQLIAAEVAEQPLGRLLLLDLYVRTTDHDLKTVISSLDWGKLFSGTVTPEIQGKAASKVYLSGLSALAAHSGSRQLAFYAVFFSGGPEEWAILAAADSKAPEIVREIADFLLRAESIDFALRHFEKDYMLFFSDHTRLNTWRELIMEIRGDLRVSGFKDMMDGYLDKLKKRIGQEQGMQSAFHRPGLIFEIAEQRAAQLRGALPTPTLLELNVIVEVAKIVVVMGAVFFLSMVLEAFSLTRAFKRAIGQGVRLILAFLTWPVMRLVYRTSAYRRYRDAQARRQRSRDFNLSFLQDEQSPARRISREWNALLTQWGDAGPAARPWRQLSGEMVAKGRDFLMAIPYVVRNISPKDETRLMEVYALITLSIRSARSFLEQAEHLSGDEQVLLQIRARRMVRLGRSAFWHFRALNEAITKTNFQAYPLWLIRVIFGYQTQIERAEREMVTALREMMNSANELLPHFYTVPPEQTQKQINEDSLRRQETAHIEALIEQTVRRLRSTLPKFASYARQKIRRDRATRLDALISVTAVIGVPVLLVFMGTGVLFSWWGLLLGVLFMGAVRGIMLHWYYAVKTNPKYNRWMKTADALLRPLEECLETALAAVAAEPAAEPRVLMEIAARERKNALHEEGQSAEPALQLILVPCLSPEDAEQVVRWVQRRRAQGILRHDLTVLPYVSTRPGSGGAFVEGEMRVLPEAIRAARQADSDDDLDPELRILRAHVLKAGTGADADGLRYAFLLGGVGHFPATADISAPDFLSETYRQDAWIRKDQIPAMLLPLPENLFGNGFCMLDLGFANAVLWARIMAAKRQAGWELFYLDHPTLEQIGFGEEDLTIVVAPTSQAKIMEEKQNVAVALSGLMVFKLLRNYATDNGTEEQQQLQDLLGDVLAQSTFEDLYNLANLYVNQFKGVVGAFALRNGPGAQSLREYFEFVYEQLGDDKATLWAELQKYMTELPAEDREQLLRSLAPLAGESPNLHEKNSRTLSVMPQDVVNRLGKKLREESFEFDFLELLIFVVMLGNNENIAAFETIVHDRLSDEQANTLRAITGFLRSRRAMITARAGLYMAPGEVMGVTHIRTAASLQAWHERINGVLPNPVALLISNAAVVQPASSPASPPALADIPLSPRTMHLQQTEQPVAAAI
ncbi:MAG: hypothetical protein NC924_02080 [Candidatus Omnitrophica bacterium]|nr:hypothetical protein [Candidatus Omnitrophota bacterium]